MPGAGVTPGRVRGGVGAVRGGVSADGSERDSKDSPGASPGRVRGGFGAGELTLRCRRVGRRTLDSLTVGLRGGDRASPGRYLNRGGGVDAAMQAWRAEWERPRRPCPARLRGGGPTWSGAGKPMP